MGNQYLNNVFNPNSTDLLASTDEATITNFWKQNVITVGFGRTTASMIQQGDYLTFMAPLTTSPPAPTLIQVQELILDQNGDYYVKRSIPAIAAGKQITIYVQANFKNGQVIETIDAIDTISSSGTFDRVVVDIRGKLENYSTLVDNYHIRIFTTP